jgi:hypothetical protein
MLACVRGGKKHPQHKIWPYLLKKLPITRPNHVWCSDITYVPIRNGFLYLVAIMDWSTCKVLSWRLSNTLDTSFSAEVEQFIDWLQSAARLDHNDVAAEAHKNTSTAALLGTTGFRNVLVTIGQSAKSDEDAKAKSTIATRPDIWKRGKKALTEVAFKE